MDCWADNVEKFIGLWIFRLKAAVGGNHVQPVGEEQVYLAGIFTQGRKAGGVVRGVERSADALLGIQLYLRRRGFRLAMSAARQEPAMFLRFLLFSFFQGVIGTLLLRQQQLRELLVAEGGIHEKSDQQRDADTEHVKQTPKTFPARTPRIIENLLGH